jgi:hypothetical protein
MFSAALLISFAALWDANKEINVKESKGFKHFFQDIYHLVSQGINEDSVIKFQMHYAILHVYFTCCM